MVRGKQGSHGWRGGYWRVAPVFALLVGLAFFAPVSAQMFSDRPPPVPPASVPEAPAGPAMNLAPSSGSASIPSLPAPLTQPSIVVAPPAAAPPAASTAGQAVLALTARY